MLDLDRASVFVLGRVHGLTRQQLGAAVSRAGAHLQTRLKKRVTLVAVGSGTAHALLTGSRMIHVLERMPDHAALISELSLQRSLGLAPPPVEEERWMTIEDVARLSGLDEEFLFWLALFDVIEPVEEFYGYRDLVSAKEAARLMREGCDFAALVTAAVALRREGTRLSEVRLTVGPDGAVGRNIEGVVARLDGQFALPFEALPERIDDIVECAEEAEMLGDLEAAERLYDLAMKMDRDDPITPFNLGNVLDAQGRHAEARILWRKAIARAPHFPEAWFNLAVAEEDGGRKDEAITCYCKALEIAGNYADAAYNLALLLQSLDRFADALPVWEHFIGLEPGTPAADTARKRAIECRFRMRGLSIAE
ncbi:tetratricopeptide repeat protein [Terrihabitans soli]|uniref:tetratricopeptide repeat protein n=1 Tax=Terrihabitans soli TaxID=708113 RepID=UPI001CA3751B|nr:tetratricopeptide repeat protein [Terrihabitans soli]